MSLTSHFASSYAKQQGMPKHEAVVVVALAYLVANFVTFITRFLIFHYVLFSDRGAKPPTAASPEAEALSPIAAMVPSSDENEQRS